MSRRPSRTISLAVERVESRQLLSAGLPAVTPVAAIHEMTSHRIAPVETAHILHKEYDLHSLLREFGGPGFDTFLRGGTLHHAHLRQTAAVNNYAVVTITNTTNTGVNFLISAYPFEGGKFIPVSLAAAGFPGSTSSYFTIFYNGQTPRFAVSFNGGLTSIPLANFNTVQHTYPWLPPASAGWPYNLVRQTTGYNVVSAV